jgi:hypothetical protein
MVALVKLWTPHEVGHQLFGGLDEALAFLRTARYDAWHYRLRVRVEDDARYRDGEDLIALGEALVVEVDYTPNRSEIVAWTGRPELEE